METSINWSDLKIFIDRNKCKNLLKSIDLEGYIHIWLVYNGEKLVCDIYEIDTENYNDYLLNYKNSESYLDFPTKIVKCSSYQDWCNYVESKKLLVTFIESANSYDLIAFDGTYFRYDYTITWEEYPYVENVDKENFDNSYKISPHTNNALSKDDPLKYSSGKQFRPSGQAKEIAVSSTDYVEFIYGHDVKVRGFNVFVDGSKGDYAEVYVYYGETKVDQFAETMYIHPDVKQYSYKGSDLIVKTLSAGLSLRLYYTNTSSTHVPYLVVHLEKFENNEDFGK